MQQRAVATHHTTYAAATPTAVHTPLLTAPLAWATHHTTYAAATPTAVYSQPLYRCSKLLACRLAALGERALAERRDARLLKGLPWVCKGDQKGKKI